MSKNGILVVVVTQFFFFFRGDKSSFKNIRKMFELSRNVKVKQGCNYRVDLLKPISFFQVFFINCCPNNFGGGLERNQYSNMMIPIELGSYVDFSFKYELIQRFYHFKTSFTHTCTKTWCARM